MWIRCNNEKRYLPTCLSGTCVLYVGFSVSRLARPRSTSGDRLLGCSRITNRRSNFFFQSSSGYKDMWRSVSKRYEPYAWTQNNIIATMPSEYSLRKRWVYTCLHCAAIISCHVNWRSTKSDCYLCIMGATECRIYVRKDTDKSGQGQGHIEWCKTQRMWCMIKSCWGEQDIDSVSVALGLNHGSKVGQVIIKFIRAHCIHVFQESEGKWRLNR